MQSTAINQNSSVPASPRYYDPTNDVAFKRLFRDKRRLMRFLNAILHKNEDEQIVDLEFMSQQEVPDIKEGRSSIFDIKCTDQSGNIFIVEMQNRTEPHFINRMQHYASHSIASQAKKGETHINLMQVILVAICNHIVFQDDKVECINYHWTVETKTQKRFLYALSYVFIELPKFKKSAEELETNEDEWLYFFANWDQTAEPPETINDPIVLEAYKEMEHFNWTKEQYEEYYLAKLAADAYVGTMEAKLQEGREEGRIEGIEEGIKKGIKKGIEKGKEEERETILSGLVEYMLASGKKLKEISELTGISMDELRKYQGDKDDR